MSLNPHSPVASYKFRAGWVDKRTDDGRTILGAPTLRRENFVHFLDGANIRQIGWITDLEVDLYDGTWFKPIRVTVDLDLDLVPPGAYAPCLDIVSYSRGTLSADFNTAIVFLDPVIGGLTLIPDACNAWGETWTLPDISTDPVRF